MGVLDQIGQFAGGIAAGRDARKENAAKAESTNAIREALSGKAKPAVGLGGTPVTTSGKAIDMDKSLAAGSPTNSGGQPVKKQGTLGKVGGVVKSLLGFKEGGRITSSGIAFVHKGETIIPASKSAERKALRGSARKSGRR